MKRTVDIVISVFLLIIFSPLLIPVIIGLRLTGEGDVWYLQKRIGHLNNEFKIWKFATMLRDSPSMLTGSLTLRDDPRVTLLGKYLRATKINELPQIVNVLTGDMSLVGPRPQMQVDFLAYPHHVQEKIYRVKPGITGLGSIIFRDEEKMISLAGDSPREFYNEIIAPYKGQLELWYQENISFGLDLKILWLTLLVVVFPKLSVQSFFKDLPEAPEEMAVHL
ncbi:MAG: sugar transferase [Saprospiraceae bacterium]|nr:sugar transferase [Saprospiraceae bacterium]